MRNETIHLLVLLFINLTLFSHVVSPSNVIPKISLEKLKQGNLEDAKTEYGDTLEALIVTDLSEDYQTALDNLIKKAPGCLTGLHHHHMHHLPKTHMLDGSVRTTYATEDAAFPSCLDMMGHLTNAFDEVENAVSELVQKAYGDQKELGYVTGSGHHPEVTILKNAPVKDHVHVYQKSPESSEDQVNMVPYHTDNGLFLILTPFPHVGLKIRLGDGTEIQTADHIKTRSLLVLMGRGLTQWLLQEGGYPKSKTLFQAGEHAVPALSSSDAVTARSVYARMKVAPGNAIPASLIRKEGSSSVTGLKTFDEVFMERVASSSSKGLCSVGLYQRPTKASESLEDIGAWSKAMDLLCEKGTAYCWMNCLPIPEQCLDDPINNNLKCYNPDNMSEDCRAPDTMDMKCAWHCNGKRNLTNDFCNGKMDMLMNGFQAAGVDNANPCVILFISAWTLDTRLKFGFACIGVMFLGFLVEVVIYVRRKLTTRRRLSAYLSAPPSLKRLASIFLFGLNLVLGYLAMLVAMTYSIELFLCVVVGIMIGHAVFNIRQPVGETIDPCCAPSQDNQPLTIENGVFGHGISSDGPLTRTPPCENGPCGPGSSRPAVNLLNSPSPEPPAYNNGSDNDLVTSSSTCQTTVAPSAPPTHKKSCH